MSAKFLQGNGQNDDERKPQWIEMTQLNKLLRLAMNHFWIFKATVEKIASS